MAYSTDDVKLALKILKHLTKGPDPELKITTNHEPDPVPIAKLIHRHIRKYIQDSSKVVKPVLEKKVMSPEKFIERHEADYSDDVEILPFQKSLSRIEDGVDIIGALPSVSFDTISEFNDDLNKVAKELDISDKHAQKFKQMKLNELKRTIRFMKNYKGNHQSILYDLNCVIGNLYCMVQKVIEQAEKDESEDESEDESDEE
jgi:hypothetical protein